MPPNAPISIESRALGTLDYIRASIDSSSSMAVPGRAGLVMGAIGFVATAVTLLPPATEYWMQIWLIAACAALGLGGAMMARETAQRGHARYLGPVRRFLLCLCPALLAGAVLTFVLWRAEQATLIPGVWLLLYGCAILSASTVTMAGTMRLIGIMGALFVLLGLGAFAAPFKLQVLILGLGFGALHTVFGFLIGELKSGE